MTTADEIGAIFRNQAAPVLVEAFGADTFVVQRQAMVSDGRGGEKKSGDPTNVLQPPYLVNGQDLSSRCRLYTATRQTEDRVAGDLIVGRSQYLVDLPLTTDITRTDDILINGTRRFAVIDDALPGKIGVYRTVTVEER